jgi:hypothetical protein
MDRRQMENPAEGILYHGQRPYNFDGVMQGFPSSRDSLFSKRKFFCGAPHNRWLNQHFVEVYPHQRVSRGSDPVTTLKRQPMNDLVNGLQVSSGEGKTFTVREHLEHNYTDGFLVIYDGNIISEHYFAGMERDTLHALWSMSKSITATVAANLLDLGKLHRDDDVTTYIPELKAAYEGVQIRHVLDMQSGVDYALAPPGYMGDPAGPEMQDSDCHVARDFRAMGNWYKLPSEPRGSGRYDFIRTLTSRAYPPGTLFRYRPADTFVLAWACEKAGNKRFADLLSQHIWSRLGVEHDAMIQADGLGAPIPDQGISATLSGIGLWGEMLRNRGWLNGVRVVPDDFIHDTLFQAEPDKW